MSTPTRWIIAAGAVLIVAAAGVWWAMSARSAETAPDAGILPLETEMGVVEIAARDVEELTAYYRDAIGLTVLEESDGIAVLGLDEPLIRLESTDAAADDPRSAGLYHSAILYADEPSLARTLVNVATVAPESFQGSADHAVSLAFYLGDPEGNGIELYVDRPRDEWEWQDGRVTMGSAPLDPNAFIAEHLEAEASENASMGHVHLRVGDLDDARAFYSDVLGFDVTAESDGAVFYSAGGYHHHLATNTWQSAGAGERPESAGLRGITVAVPSASDLDDLVKRLTDAGIEHSADDSAVTSADPWGNTVRFVLS